MKYIIPLSLLVFLFSGTAFSQKTQPLSLEQAITYALENKADVKKAKLDVKNSEYLIQEARAGALPMITGDGGLTYNPILQETAIPTEDFPGMPSDEPFITLSMGLDWSSRIGANLTQNIFNMAVFTGLKAARTTREFYHINAQLTEEEVIERVATAYYNVFVEKEKLKTLNKSYENLEKSKHAIKGLLDNGLAKEVDLDRVSVQLTNIGTNRQQLINGIQMRENALKFYIGMPMNQALELVEEEFSVTPISLTEEVNVENRTEMQVQRKQEELLELQKKAKKAEYYPTLALTAGYNYMGQGNRFPIGANLDKGVFWSDYASVGLNLSIPIFNGFATKAKVNQANIELKTAQEDIKDTKLALDMEYQNARSEIENNLIAIENQEDNVSLAQKVVNNTENNYKQGLASLTDLLEAENALVDAKNNYSNALLQYKLAEIKFLKSTGDLKTLQEN